MNAALDVAPHDVDVGRMVSGYLDKIRGFFSRNIEAAREAGQVPRRTDAEAVRPSCWA